MKYMEIGTLKMAYEVYGDSRDTLVIDVCLGSCSAEWWHIARQLSSSLTVVVFDRAGYGGSPASRLPRTPQNIAVELNALLEGMGIRSNIILAGHSQGGYFAVQYALMYPEKVKGIVLLDPATPFDDEFHRRLTSQQYKMSGADKTQSYRLGHLLSSIRLGFLFKPLLKKSPPFCYHTFDQEAEQYLLKSMMRSNTYKTALDEYNYTHQNETTSSFMEAVKIGALGAIPLRLITHSSDSYIRELARYTGLDIDTAAKIEMIWQEVMCRCLTLSSNSVHIMAPNSSHYIHLTDFKLFKQTVLSLL